MSVDKITYAVRRLDNDSKGIYELTKFIEDAIPTETYVVNLMGYPTCDCMGFRMHLSQRENPEKHKHIRAVRLFVSHDEPFGAVLTIDKKGRASISKDKALDSIESSSDALFKEVKF